MVTPLTQAGRPPRGLVWDGENFAFAHVRFEMLAKHRDRELVHPGKGEIEDGYGQNL